MQDPYPAVDAAAGGSVSDFVVARKLAEDFEENESDETTMAPAETLELTKRSISEDIMVFTRAGSYHLIENRLNK